MTSAGSRARYELNDGRHFPNTFPEFDPNKGEVLVGPDGKVSCASIIDSFSYPNSSIESLLFARSNLMRPLENVIKDGGAYANLTFECPCMAI